MFKEIIHFAHANGFPAETYSKLFSFLEKDFEIGYLGRHAHNRKFPVANGWERLRDELREEMQKRYTKKLSASDTVWAEFCIFSLRLKIPNFTKQ